MLSKIEAVSDKGFWGEEKLDDGAAERDSVTFFDLLSGDFDAASSSAELSALRLEPGAGVAAKEKRGGSAAVLFEDGATAPAKMLPAGS